MKSRNLFLLTNSDDDMINIIKDRIKFYFGEVPNIQVINRVNLNLIFSNNLILVYNFDIPRFLIFKYSNFILIDENSNPLDGWSWHRALNYFNGLDVTGVSHSTTIKNYIKFLAVLKKSYIFYPFGLLLHYLLKKFEHLLDIENDTLRNSKTIFFRLKKYFIHKKKYSKIYLFGTGPSLSKAKNKNWSNGIRLVCNTIVKNKDLWHHINPNFIVAGDAIYHFGDSAFSLQFQKDLKNRLSETETYFIYPLEFNSYISREFKKFSEKLIPIPVLNKKGFDYTFNNSFSLPQLGNSLSLLSIPVAKNLSFKINLWGYDGKGPNDNDFWKNSDENFYHDYIDKLKLRHPAFFKFFLSTKEKYAVNYFGYKFEKNLQKLENNGWKIKMLHQSWTIPLKKRYNE